MRTNQRIAFIAIIPVLASVLVRAQTPQSSFEAVSIRPSKPGAQGHFSLQNGRISGDGLLWTYIISAWKLMLSPDQIDAMTAHLPKWVSTDSYEINAVAEGNPSPDQMRVMLQSLLADRFGLKVHFETAETPVLALVPDKPGKMGTKLRPHSEGPTCDIQLGSQTSDSAGNAATVFPPVCGMFSASGRADHVVLVGAREVTMAQIAEFVTSLGRVGRPVVDDSGFGGKMDFTLEFVPGPRGGLAAGQTSSLDTAGPTLEEALQEQLGLKLKVATAPIRTLVVDHVEKPSAN